MMNSHLLLVVESEDPIPQDSDPGTQVAAEVLEEDLVVFDEVWVRRMIEFE